MKKTVILFVLTLVLAVLLAGCGAFSLSFTTLGGNTTIEVNDVEDGTAGESNWFSVSKGKTVVIESSLEKGKLKIDFAEATVFHHADEPEDVIVGDVAASVTVGAGEREELSVEPGDYVLQVTAVGKTNGKVAVRLEK